jgi:phage baseplate assembly protein W
LPGAPDGETEAQGDAYGVDVFFDGKHRVTPAGDYQEVAGEENLRRSIFRRLITRPGEYRLNPNYGAGVPSYVKKKRSAANLSELTNRVKAQIQRDRRVQKVLGVTITREQYGYDTGIKVVVVVQAFGRTLRPLVYDFKKEI